MNTSNLSPLQKKRLLEYFKCKNDPNYFIENYIKLALTGGDRTVKLYDKQKDFVNLVYEKHHVITLKTRQTGLSTIAQMLICHVMNFHQNCIIGVISKSGSESTNFCRKVLSMLDSLPEWMRTGFRKRTEQSFILNNGSEFYASQVNDANPEGTLRSYSITLLVIDEAAFVTKIDEAYTSCAPTLFKAQQMAKQQNIPYGTLIISTPNKTVGRGKWYYQNWVSAHKGESIFQPFKLHWKEIPEYANDKEWYATQCRLLNNVQWKIAQELDMQFVASSNSFFPSDTITLLNKSPIEPVHNLKFFNHDLKIFELNQEDKFYLIGVDTASESGIDSSSIEVCDFETLQQVAEYKSNNIRVDNFCSVVSKVSSIYSNNLLIVESNSYGNQVCEYLTRRDGYHNIYKTKQRIATIDSAMRKAVPKYKYGIYTGPQNRPLIIDALYTYIVDNPSIIKSESLCLELIGLIDKSGKIQADEGEHDDLAMSYGFCCYVKLYDPPLGMAHKFTESGGIKDLEDIANWNTSDNIMTSTNVISLKDIKTTDRIDLLEKSNKLLNKHIKDNLSIIQGDNHNNMIDVFNILDMNKKTNREP